MNLKNPLSKLNVLQKRKANMKYCTILLSTVLLFNCKTKVKSKVDNSSDFKTTSIVRQDTKIEKEIIVSNSIKDSIITTKVPQKSVTNKNDESLPIDLNEILEKKLIGLAVNDEVGNIIEKYSIDVSGICYSCETANIMINKNYLILSNSCDDSESTSFKIVSISEKDKNVEISFLQNQQNVNFSIFKIEKLPVFKMKISKNFISNDNLKINEFYTTSIAVKKLKHNNCDDFEG